jgi:hypothetical protein
MSSEVPNSTSHTHPGRYPFELPADMVERKFQGLWMAWQDVCFAGESFDGTGQSRYHPHLNLEHLLGALGRQALPTCQ